MVGRNTNVSKILVPKVGTSILGVGNTISSLAIGQIGIFDSNTGLSIDAAGAGAVRKFFIAIARSSNGGSVIDEMDESAGQSIQKSKIEEYTYREHSAGRAHVIEVKGFRDVQCDTEYCIKVAYRNDETRTHMGFTPFHKSYVIKTACCTDCETCGTGDINDVNIRFYNLINTDTLGFAVAKILADSVITIATHSTSADYAVGDEMTMADVEVILAWNKAQTDDTTKVYSKLELTSTPVAIREYCAINQMYYGPRETELIVSPTCGFECGPITIEETQALAFEEGSGYDLQNREFLLNTNKSPYKQSGILADVHDATPYRADKNAKYDEINLHYINKEAGTGGNNTDNNMLTTIATTVADTALRASIVAILDALITPGGFDPLADDAAASNADPTVVSETEDTTESTDGQA